MRKLILPLTVLLAAGCTDEGPIVPPENPANDALAYGQNTGAFFDLGLVLPTLPSGGDGPLLVVDPGTLLNGSFEANGGPSSTVLNSWGQSNSGSGSWFAQTGTASPLSGFGVPAPPNGAFAAMTDQFGPGSHILFQDVTLPNALHVLHFDFFIGNRAGVFFSPPSLSQTVFPNQQFRVDIMNPAAPVADVGAGVLANVYQSQPGDVAVMPGYAHVAFDMSAFSGQTVRIRFAQVDNLFFFQAGADDVFLDRLTPSTKDECQKGGWQQFGFENQGQCVRFIETGGSGPMATGSGHRVDPRGPNPGFRNFSFVAHSNGGQFQIKNRSFDAKLHGSIECVTVVGNQAWFAGTVTQSDFGPIPVGSIRAFTVVDNGEGSKKDQPDQIARSVGLVTISAQDWCDLTPVRTLFDIEQGNIQVH